MHKFKRQMKTYILRLRLLFVGDYVRPNEASANLSFNVNVLMTLRSGYVIILTINGRRVCLSAPITQYSVTKFHLHYSETEQNQNM